MDFNKVKSQEARNRTTAIRQARRNSRVAAGLQRRFSLVGNGAKWQIVNLTQVARALARQA